MSNWLSKLFRPQTAQEDSPDLLDLEGQSQALRLELAESQRARILLGEQLEQMRRRADAQAQERSQVRMQALLAEVAAPVSQLLTQVHLLETQGIAVESRDVLAVVKRLLQGLEAQGVTLEGEIGERAPFDPDLHEPLGGPAPETGQPVVIRFVGLAYQDRLIHKAGVTPVSEAGGG